METLNISSKSEDLRGRELSNFMIRPFVLDDVKLWSMEGFIQGTKLPEGHPLREKVFGLAGIEAKKMGYELAHGGENTYVWWKGEKIVYGSAEHHQLIARAIEASFRQNPWAFLLLRSTRGLKLTHEVGGSTTDSALPPEVFCAILEKLRDEEDAAADGCIRGLRVQSEHRLDELMSAAKSIEADGIEAFQSVTDRCGRDIALALLVAHLRHQLGSDRSFPPDPEIDDRVSRLLAEARIIEP